MSCRIGLQHNLHTHRAPCCVFLMPCNANATYAASGNASLRPYLQNHGKSLLFVHMSQHVSYTLLELLLTPPL